MSKIPTLLREEDFMLVLAIVVVVFLVLVGKRIYDDWVFVRHMAHTIEDGTSRDDPKQDSH
jgi:hypothetical protein